jgi:[ribosomal protein S5]-alanine N-acetyltransferase
VPIPLPIETERLTIRRFDPEEDAEAMVDVYCDAEVMRHIPGGVLPDIDAVRERLELYASRTPSSWALVLRENGRLVGDAGYHFFPPTGDFEVGWTLARPFWGHGYATEAGTACLQAGLEHLDVPRIICLVDVDNAPSLRVAERLGMTRLDTIDADGRPHVLFEARR